MTITANYTEPGDTIKIGNKAISLTEVQVHVGGFGEYVILKGIDTKTDNYIRPLKLEWTTLIEKI
jgi:hypothetical protein